MTKKAKPEFLIELVIKSQNIKDEEVKQAIETCVQLIFVEIPRYGATEGPEFFESFLVDFNKLKGQVKDNIGHIEILVSNKNLGFERLIIDLMNHWLKFEHLESLYQGTKFANVPDVFQKEKRSFMQYKPAIFKSGRTIIQRYFEITKKFAMDCGIEVPEWFYELAHKKKLEPLKPSWQGLYNVHGYLEDACGDDDDDHWEKDWLNELDIAISGINFIESSILGCTLDQLYDRWITVPTIQIPNLIAVKNPQAIYNYYSEIAKTYATGNLIACLVLCRALLEYCLNKYFGSDHKKGLEAKIEHAECQDIKIKKFKFKKHKKKADDLIHNYDGGEIDDATVKSFIVNLKWLIDAIPIKKR